MGRSERASVNSGMTSASRKTRSLELPSGWKAARRKASRSTCRLLQSQYPDQPFRQGSEDPEVSRPPTTLFGNPTRQLPPILFQVTAKLAGRLHRPATLAQGLQRYLKPDVCLPQPCGASRRRPDSGHPGASARIPDPLTGKRNVCGDYHSAGYFFSPASTAMVRRFSRGGRGHVAYGVNAQGGL